MILYEYYTGVTEYLLIITFTINIQQFIKYKTQ